MLGTDMPPGYRQIAGACSDPALLDSSVLGVTLVALMIGAALISFHAGPTFAIVQSAVPPSMRALAAALLIGRLSDALAATHGTDSLRVALLIVPVLYAWAACHYYAAARAIGAQLDAAGVAAEGG